MTVAPRAVVALIVHHPTLTPVERAGALQCLAVLKSHAVVAVAPEGMELPRIVRHLPVERFSPENFASVRDYNRMMMSPAFYERFAAFEYLLIHQLDAFVFRDELQEWCARGFDYVGAPWRGMRFPDDPDWVRLLGPFMPSENEKQWNDRTHVGNGGLSLRRVATFCRILSKLDEVKNVWGDRHEDAFWGIAARLCMPDTEYRVPSEEEAMSFAWETRPEECFLQLGRLPFGCHAWDKVAPAFWRPWIRKAGYRVRVPGDGGWQDRLAWGAWRLKQRQRPQICGAGQ